MVTLPSLAFFFVIVVLDYEWREAPMHGVASYEECKELQQFYRESEEIGHFSECYGRVVNEHGT